jgi:uncharacterized protein (TIGR03663 family)
MAVIPQETNEYPQANILTRRLDVARINYELLAFVGIVVLSIVAHLYNLGQMALHHDESIHAWMSWKFFTGSGGFTCYGGRNAPTYCYEPTYHGPSLYIFTFLSYFLFGDGDWQARIPQAVSGIALVASVWMLRPYLGTKGTLLAALLLGFTPALLYYTRFARHDGLIVLYTLWMVIGFVRYMDTSRPYYLILLAAGTSLAIATHELYYILFFIFGWFCILRYAFERLQRRTYNTILLVIIGVAIAVEIWNPRITPTLRAAGMATLFITVALCGLLMARIWDATPILSNRIRSLWFEQRSALWTALAVLGAIYVLMYSTFFADPQSLLTGLYAGITYWLGSQQEAARGDQPWYYHLMLLSIYEPLAFFGSIAAAVYIFTRGVQLPNVAGNASKRKAEETASAESETPEETPANGAETEQAEETRAPIEPIIARLPTPLFPLLLVFWFFTSLVAFSWAGEKMPWLVTHITLPGNLLIAWALGKMLDTIHWREISDRRAILIPPAFIVMVVALGVAYWRFSTPASDQVGQAALLQGIVPLLVGAGLLYLLLTIAQRIGWRITAAFIGTTIAVILGLYTIRATWLVVYAHPDTPVEPLVYVQSSPDVPLIVKNLREMAINQTRNVRNENDPIGGLTMPIIMDAGNTQGDGSLAWPYQWYFRNHLRLENRNSDFFSTATSETFIVEPVQPGADRELAPVIMLSKGSITEATRTALEANYVKRFDSKLNWWFPEGYKCDTQTAGYKRFYYSSWMITDAIKDCPDIDITKVPNVLAPLLWPFDGSHWGNTWKFLLYRELPEPLRLDGREMEVWVRSDLAPTGSSGPAAAASSVVKLVAQQSFGSNGNAAGQLNNPSSAVTDAQGNLYVADTNNNRISVFAPDGTFLRDIGSFGSDDGQLFEPRGVALDAQGFIYVADTWNARVAKFDPAGTFVTAWGIGSEDFGNGRRATPTDGTLAGNAAQPLGFFGPRGIALDADGRVYIADTGNKRIVVTDSEGNFLFQFGEFGAAPGQFSEPTSVAVDGNTIYVADTWNGRVQVFLRDEEGQINSTPIATWRVVGWLPQTYDDPAITARNGQVAVSIPGRNTIWLTDSTGQERLRWGGAGSDTASLQLPSGLALAEDGTIYVVDRGNSRILHFRLPSQ